MKLEKTWQVKQGNPALEYILQHELGVSAVLARLLVNRGIYTVEEARVYLEAEPTQWYDPFLLADMEKAVARIQQALRLSENIFIYGDYDADGITSTALLVKVLRCLGGNVQFFIPQRLTQGYGLHLPAVQEIWHQGCSLLITVDCGISALEVVQAVLAAGGPDIIITDHHEVPDILPPALAVINPKRKDCSYPFKELAGVGVALKLAQGILQENMESIQWQEYLDLACVGTIADVVDLQGENRMLVKQGLAQISSHSSPGLQALLTVAGIKEESLRAREIAFGVAPRLNAAGRMGDATMAVDLLLSENPDEAAALAIQLNKINQDRQRTESVVLAEALGMLDGNPALCTEVIVLGTKDWHPGVIGIVASRLVEKYSRPVLLVAFTSEGEGKGSGRSIPGFHLYEALAHCQEYLLNFGGHAQAVGFSLAPEHLDLFRQAINDHAARVRVQDGLGLTLDLDGLVSLEDISLSLAEEISLLAPLGQGNPGPLLGCYKAQLLSCRSVGRDNKHVKLLVKGEQVVLDGIAFHQAHRLAALEETKTVDLAFVPTINHWNGKTSVQLEIMDMKPSSQEIAWTGRPEHTMFLSPEEALQSMENLGTAAFLPTFAVQQLQGASCMLPFLNTSVPWEAYGHRMKETKQETEDAGSIKHCALQPAFHPIAHRPWGLKMLLQRPGTSLVIACSPVRTVELAFYLQGEGIPAVFLHRGLEKDRITFCLQKAWEQALVMVITPEMLPLLEEHMPERIVYYDPPFSKEELWYTNPEYQACKVYDGFGPKGLEDCSKMAAACFPDREMLLKMYAHMRRKGPKIQLSSEAVPSFLRQAGLTNAGEMTMALGLGIFAELGLLQYEWEPGPHPGCMVYRLQLLPTKGKKDLSCSAAFCASKTAREMVTGWWKELLSLCEGVKQQQSEILI